ncbi:apolipoprotein N-acyltransferase [Inmirania thermothiophila]|uniref:Apolipoprotein N-acyltransferase n=1 Tax=Inmirania thermothiophila TaxID=1750597 RepID=A0A3N1Y7R0_9GAMM|nr:apolipoprotein N-acyltransferase [Inmirania thermothiophila]ROR34859.1 apolipoprotein N-acyltransferase [Inmirania thermothiophila]
MAAARGRARAADLAALAAGAVFPAGFAPLAWWPLAILAPAALAQLARGATPGRALLRGWLFGLGAFGVGVSWVWISIARYGNTGAATAWAATAAFVALLALFPALTAGLWRRLAPAGGVRAGLAFAALWALAEWVRARLWAGFPWLEVGVAQVDGPLGGWLAVLGPYGTGGVALAGAAVFAAGVKKSDRWAGAALLAAAVAGGAVLGAVPWTRPAGPARSVAVVQGNIAQDVKWAPEAVLPTLERYLGMSRPLWGTDLVVWPETAVPLFLDEVEAGFLDALAAEAGAAGTTLVTGIPLRDAPGGPYYNGVVVAGGGAGAVYRKRHLVPFGEYYPGRAWLGGLFRILDVPMSDFAPGPPDPAPVAAAGMRLGITICYEIAFPALVHGDGGAALLVNVSNDAWFGDSLAPHQHLQIARARAREAGRYLVRATNTGVSAVIGPDGRVLARGPQFAPAVVRAAVRPMAGRGPYARLGDGPALAGLLGLVAAAAARRRR